MPINFDNPKVQATIKKVGNQQFKYYRNLYDYILDNTGDTTEAFRVADRAGIRDSLEYALRREGIIDSNAIKDYQDFILDGYKKHINRTGSARIMTPAQREAEYTTQQADRRIAARQARRQAPARQRQQLRAIPEQAAPRRAAAAAQTVREPMVRVDVRDLPENIRPLGEALDRANQTVDQREYTFNRVRSQERGPVTREKRLLDEAIETRNRAQTALEEAIDRNIPEGDRPRIKQGLRNNKILRSAGKGVAGMAALSEGLNLLADHPKEVKGVASDALEAAKSPLRTAKEFGKEAADFYRIMTGSGKSAKAIKKKMGKDVKKADKAAFDFLLKTVLSPEQIKAATQPKEPQA